MENTEPELESISADYKVKPVMYNRHFFVYKDDKIVHEFDFEHDERINSDRKTIDEIILHQVALKQLMKKIKQELINYEGSEEEYKKNYHRYSFLN